MNLIKTCYGEWINPSLVKYFSADYAEDDGEYFVEIRADGVTLQTFKVVEPPDCPERPKYYSDFSCDEKSKAYEAAYEKWRDAYNENKRKTRAEACAWLADFVNELKQEAKS